MTLKINQKVHLQKCILTNFLFPPESEVCPNIPPAVNALHSKKVPTPEQSVFSDKSFTHLLIKMLKMLLNKF